MTFWWRAPLPLSSSSAGIYQLYIETIEIDINVCQNQCDYVFVLPHWGEERTFLPTLHERRLAIRMIKAGATGKFVHIHIRFNQRCSIKANLSVIVWAILCSLIFYVFRSASLLPC